MRIVALLLIAALAAQSAKSPIPVAWTRVPEELAGLYVSVTLTGDLRVQGYWASVGVDTFTMRVDKTSRKQMVAKGLQTIPRSSIIRIDARKKRIRGRVVGTLVGWYGFIALAAASQAEPDAWVGALGLATIASGVLGFFVGRSIDHEMREYVILPEKQSGKLPNPGENANVF